MTIPDDLRKDIRHRTEIAAKGGNPPPKYHAKALAEKYGLTERDIVRLLRGPREHDDG